MNIFEKIFLYFVYVLNDDYYEVEVVIDLEIVVCVVFGKGIYFVCLIML